jgi:single-strand DNA-binding protein
MNKVFLSGRLVRDPEIKTTGSGKSLCTFSIANDIHFGDKKKTGFYRVTAWGNQANVIAQHCKTGYQIFITGRLDHNSWKDSNGGNRSDVSVILEHFDFGQKPLRNPGNAAAS